MPMSEVMRSIPTGCLCKLPIKKKIPFLKWKTLDSIIDAIQTEQNEIIGK